jgi:hypothetical protein
MAGRSGRSSDEIRASIESNRAALAVSVAKLRGEVAEITDWRRQLDDHRRPALLGAAITGFLLAGGLAVFGRRRRRH